MDEIKRILPDEVFSEAANVLETVAKTPEQKQHYEARLKFQRDEAARTKFAIEKGREQGREQGREEGREEGLRDGIEQGLEKGREVGVLLGRIATLQELLGITSPTAEELSSHDLKQLSELVSQLRDRLRTRNPS